MKSNWRFNVLDTITVDLKENPQTVIDRMRRLHYLETGVTGLDDTGVMMKCKRNGQFRLQPFWNRVGSGYNASVRFKKRLWHGPVSVRGEIVPNEDGTTHVSADIVYDKWEKGIVLFIGLIASALSALYAWWQYQMLGFVKTGATVQMGAAVIIMLGGTAMLFSKKKDQYDTINKLRVELDKRIQALTRWDD